ncbi:unnamed protein product [Prorocentrum cordatum]|uniref:FACT complex subunit n=1 Tax=Prorocentrum cordatum TaxID=2364126 RepID=A0ABN9PH43_9DINO|nr:unnamed protein product [Polarella glacialis]
MEAWTFNKDLWERSGGYLVPFTDSDLKYLTVAASHTVATVRCAMYGAKGINPEICMSDGTISKDLVLGKASSYSIPMTQGMRFLVIKWEVKEKFEGLASLLQEAFNETHASYRHESKMQTLQRIHKVLEVERGGDGPFLTEIVNYSKCIGDERKDVSTKTFTALAGAQLACAPRWIVACLKACLVAPDTFCKDGVSNMITGSDLAELQHTGKKHVQVMACDVVFGEVDAFMKTITGLAAVAAAKLAGDFQVRCVMMVMAKKAKGRKVYGTLDEIKAKFIEELCIACPLAANVTPPWTTEKDTTNAAAPSGGFVEYVQSAGGQMVVDGKVITDLGFDVGVLVKAQSGDDGIYKIVEIKGCEVKLSKDTDAPKGKCKGKGKGKAKPITITTSKLMDEYKVHVESEKFEIKVDPANAQQNPMRHKDLGSEMLKSQARSLSLAPPRLGPR